MEMGEVHKTQNKILEKINEAGKLALSVGDEQAAFFLSFFVIAYTSGLLKAWSMHSVPFVESSVLFLNQNFPELMTGLVPDSSDEFKKFVDSNLDMQKFTQQNDTKNSAKDREGIRGNTKDESSDNTKER